MQYISCLSMELTKRVACHELYYILDNFGKALS
uniref:Uncharacterized protein n=1 Tax=Rhizophora mucronata TaxID=61149 RepID=A0A2P2R414_RHIMU